jgi:hypothetical protein
LPLDPFCARPVELTQARIGDLDINEISPSSIGSLLDEGTKAQAAAASLRLSDRLSVFGALAEGWAKRLQGGSLSGLMADLVKSTGYSERLMGMEFRLVQAALHPGNLLRNLESSLGNPEGLERFVEVGDGESVRHMPAGPVFIISSGNSLIPPLIPTALSLATGNFTILRPSLSNYRGVMEVLGQVRALGTPAARLLSDLLVIGYFRHDSPALAELLTKSRLGVINFWGGEPGRTEVSKSVSGNPHHPRLVINGPLTGVAILDKPSADDAAAQGLAANMIMYNQQLCSSPTTAIFIGTHGEALEFAGRTAKALDALGGESPMQASEGAAFLLQSARRLLRFGGSTIISSQDPENLWTMVVSDGASALDGAVASLPDFGLHARRRFLELVSVRDEDAAVGLIRSIPSMKAFRGIDRVQTVGLAVSAGREEVIAGKLAGAGVFRIVPLADMSMRSPSEPYDGVSIPSSFTYAVYRRTKGLDLGGSG